MQSFFTNIICSRFSSFQFLKLLNLFFSVNICPTKKFQATFKGQSHSSNINHFHQLQFDANLTGGLFQDWVQSAVERFPVLSIMLCFAWFKLVIKVPSSVAAGQVLFGIRWKHTVTTTYYCGLRNLRNLGSIP